ncbi:MAG: hypothetical protein ABSB71_13020 [Candidatus Bathyarchaeia archaeon]|jgi:hypothetical protein
MFGANELKSAIKVTENFVECPVRNCKTIVPRQRRRFQRSDKFLCPEHAIYISPSTFEYKKQTENLLWNEEADLNLLKRIALVKRESRIARDNSEDAVTWNVFRFLEKENFLSRYLSMLSKSEIRNPEIVYWSYSQSEKNAWSKLVQARKEFELVPEKGSEPDIIIKSDKALFVIEAKLKASNKTVPSSKDPLVKEKYVTGGCGWYQDVFKSDFETVAISDRKYELLRFWLLGSWMAQNQRLRFILVNLVPAEREKDIETQFKKHIKEDTNRAFLRSTWEDIYRLIQETDNRKKHLMLDYFRNKTVGYDREGNLQRAFSV